MSPADNVVLVEIERPLLRAIVTNEVAAEMECHVGCEIVAVVKATAITYLGSAAWGIASIPKALLIVVGSCESRQATVIRMAM